MGGNPTTMVTSDSTWENGPLFYYDRYIIYIHPGVDDGGKRSGMMLVGLLDSQHQAGEGGGGGAAPRG
jgi:hypothetical protein